MVLSDDTFKQLSHSIACVRFPLVFAILLLHAYVPTIGHGMYHHTLYPFALWFGETGVPAYFFISGLLMFYSSKTYLQQVKSRYHTLFIPYILWNGLFLLAYVVVWLIGFNAEINHKSLDDYTWMDYIRAFWDRGDWDRGDGLPVLTPMWYLRNLMIMYLISPIVYYVIRATGPLVPIVAALFWFNAHSIALVLQTLTMFCLGAYFPINEINPIDFWRQYKIHIIIFFAFFGVTDMLLHQGIVDLSGLGFDIALPFHRLALIANTFFMIWLGTYLYDRGWRYPRLSKAAFFIFCTHYPVIAAIRAVAAKCPHWPDAVHLVYYTITVFVTLFICYGLFQILSRYAPWFIRLSTGDRA